MVPNMDFIYVSFLYAFVIICCGDFIDAVSHTDVPEGTCLILTCQESEEFYVFIKGI